MLLLFYAYVTFGYNRIQMFFLSGLPKCFSFCFAAFVSSITCFGIIIPVSQNGQSNTGKGPSANSQHSKAMSASTFSLLWHVAHPITTISGKAWPLRFLCRPTLFCTWSGYLAFYQTFEVLMTKNRFYNSI